MKKFLLIIFGVLNLIFSINASDKVRLHQWLPRESTPPFYHCHQTLSIRAHMTSSGLYRFVEAECGYSKILCEKRDIDVIRWQFGICDMPSKIHTQYEHCQSHRLLHPYKCKLCQKSFTIFPVPPKCLKAKPRCKRRS